MPRPYHHGSLAATIVAIARDRLRRSPQAVLSLRELARAAGVSPNAPYRHFPGKDGLTVALVVVGYRELTAIAERALASGRPITALARGYSEFATEESALLGLVDNETFLGRDPESEVVLARDEWFAALVGIVEREAGGVTSGEAYRRAAGVWAVLKGVRQLKEHGGRGLLPEELLPDPAELARQIVRGR